MMLGTDTRREIMYAYASIALPHAIDATAVASFSHPEHILSRICPRKSATFVASTQARTMSFGGFGAFGAPAVGGFGAPAAGGFGSAIAPGGGGELPALPDVIDMGRLAELESALDAAPHEGPGDLKKFLGADAAVLRTAIVDPFLKGFEIRKAFDLACKSGAFSAQPPAIAAAPAAGMFGAPQQAAPAAPMQSGEDVLQRKLAEKFSFDKILELNTANPGFRSVAAARGCLYTSCTHTHVHA